jgi:hypothetical protein
MSQKTNDVTGSENFGAGITTSTTTFIIQNSRKVESVQFIENEEGNFMEVVYRETPNYNYVTTIVFNSTYNSERMVKERYGVVDGKMQLIKTIYGSESPGYYVPPTVNWEE